MAGKNETFQLLYNLIDFLKILGLNSQRNCLHAPQGPQKSWPRSAEIAIEVNSKNP